MKGLWKVLLGLSVVLLALGANPSEAEARRSRRPSWNHRQQLTPFKEQEQQLRDLLQEFDQEEEEVADEEEEGNEVEQGDIYEMMAADQAAEDEDSLEQDPCGSLHCGAGRECVIDVDTGLGSCACVSDCGFETDPRRQVCSNHNETFNTDCELYRTRCLCEEGQDGCRDPEKFKHVHVEYYGECRSIPECSAEELLDFPRRMREWLFNVMTELSERKELSYHYRKMEKEAKRNQSKRWRNAAVWKWCDLDGHPHDNVVSRHELFPVKAPLQALEHCIGDFLDKCDQNQDHQISLQEWGKCLDIDEEDLVAECEKVDDNNKRN